MDDAMKAAYETAVAVIKTFQEQGRDRFFSDITKFGSWLTWDHDPPSGTPLVIMIVSHHSDNTLYFDHISQKPRILSRKITRKFGDYSIAIIDACGLTKPKQFDIVRTLNRKGVSSILASVTEVDAKMGGRYVCHLFEEMKPREGAQCVSLGEAAFRAASHLREDLDDGARGQDRAPYGARALLFTLLGNGAVRLGSPTVEDVGNKAQ